MSQFLSHKILIGYPQGISLSLFLSGNFVSINTIIGQVNNAKKPLGMALFLPIILTISSFLTVGNPAYQRQAGILGGPLASAAEHISSSDNSAMLISAASPIQSEDAIQAPVVVHEGIMETAMLYGGEQSAKSQEIVRQSPILQSPESGPDLGGYFSMPTQGFNWGKLHPHNAVDIANACGTPNRRFGRRNG